MKDFAYAKEQLMQEIRAEVRYTRSYLGKEVLDPKVMEAMEDVPRHEFVPSNMHNFAYDNSPLYIGHGQTISQPYIVAIMTDLICPQEDHIVLDVGTGSGYQAAVVSKLVKQVYSIERIPELAELAENRLHNLGYHNVNVSVGDGNEGLAEHAPYDGIIVAATAPFIPTALTDQLKPNGKLIIPLGQPSLAQELFLLEKDESGAIHSTNILPVSFVPLVPGTAPIREGI